MGTQSYLQLYVQVSPSVRPHGKFSMACGITTEHRFVVSGVRKKRNSFTTTCMLVPDDQFISSTINKMTFCFDIQGLI